MRFLVKLFAFGCALTAAILLLGLDKRGERKREREAARHIVAAGPVAAVHGSAVGWGTGVAHPPEEVRILTQSGTAFMSLRGDEVVAGLSDSVREVVTNEMKREMAKNPSGLGAMISGAVRSGVEKLLDKEITVPVSDIRDIDYRGNRIVIVYKDANRKRILDFDTIKDHDQSLLQQFSEEDARRLVDAVRVKIVTR
jgi:hypothetical protein